MIPDQTTLKRFLKARMNFFVYGPRASGKTTLLEDMFKQTKIEYIYINCTMGDKKSNFFRYLNHQLNKYFRRRINQDKSKILSDCYEKPSDPSSVHGWINNINSLSPEIRGYLQNVYFFIDNIQEIHLSANFMTTFFCACQQNTIDDLKIPFVFCGITLPRKIYAVDKPFRNIISFCMKKPQQLMKEIINTTVNSQFIHKFRINDQFKKRYQEDDIICAAFILANQIYHAFQPMETDLNRIKKMSSVLARQIAEVIQKQIKQDDQFKKSDKNKTLQQRMNSKINKGQIKVYTREMLQQGPIDGFIVSRKIEKQQFSVTDDPSVELNYEYYPNLILTSLHLADLGAETEDKRRFKDYKNEKGKGKKSVQNKITRHNLQRIIAISQALESHGKKDGHEFDIDHHSLYYYACFQFLRQEEKLFTPGKNLTFASSKIYGDTKQQQANTFLKLKMNLTYDDYLIR